jgi:hypothetical protein
MTSVTPTQPLRIFGWLADRDGVGYYRLILPGTALANAGHAVWLDEALPMQEAHDGEFDVIVGQRVCEPGPSAIWQKLAAAGHTKLVYEIDDDLLNVDPSNRAAWAFYEKGVSRHTDVDLMTGNRSTVSYFDDNRRARIIENIRVADAVTVSTEPLAAAVRPFNANVHVLPNQIPGWLLDFERPSTSDLVTIGWRGSATHSRDFGELAAPLKRFLQHPANRGRVELHTMGFDYGTRVAGRHGRTRHTGWVDGVESYLKAVDFDLAVMPLLSSTFNASKSDLALLEMSALGIPSIVSGHLGSPYRRLTGGYARPVAHLATAAADWTSHLTMLVNEPEMRAQLGKEAREWAASRTIERNAWRWEKAYR